MTDAAPFTRTRIGWILVLDGGLVGLAVLSSHEGAHAAVGEIVPLPRRSALRRLLIAALGVHLAEGLYAWRTARRAGLPVGAWTAQTLLVGYPSTRDLRRTVGAVGSATA